MRLFRWWLGWLVPHRLFVFFEYRRQLREQQAQRERETGPQQRLVAPNTVLHDIHKNRHCFILCNGPTVGSQDLLPLANECVISVSSGYLHPDYAALKPRYHCVPQISYEILTQQDAIKWFTEMHGKLGDAELFLSTTEESLVRENGLFAGRKIHYVFLHENFDDLAPGAIPDLAKPVPRIQSVPIMALMCALYMGFSDICLLGTEHDHYKTRIYKYFYDPTVLKGKDFSTTVDGQIISSNFDVFHELALLWHQYRAIRKIAEANGVRITNATAGGELDEFPRVSLDDIVNPVPCAKNPT